MEVSKSFSIDALLAPSANARPETPQRARAATPEVPDRDDDATSTCRDTAAASPRSVAAASPRSCADSTGSSMADDRPASALTGDQPSSPEILLGHVTSGRATTSGDVTSGHVGRHLVQSLQRAGMLDVLRARGPAAALQHPGIVPPGSGHHPPFAPFSPAAFNGLQQAAALAASLPGRCPGAARTAMSPGALQAVAAAAALGGGGGSAFHAPAGSSNAVRPAVGGRSAAATTAVTSASSSGSSGSAGCGGAAGGTTSSTSSDGALQRLAAQAAAQQQLQCSLQLDWLARAGVYMPRLIDYNGISLTHARSNI